MSAAPTCSGWQPLTQPCLSPDKRWSVKSAYHHGRGSLILTRRSNGKRAIYRSGDSCCYFVAWAKPHLLVFIDADRLVRFQPASRQKREREIPALAGFSLSPNEKWIATWTRPGPLDTPTVEVLSTYGSKCFNIGPAAASAGFSSDSKEVIVGRVSSAADGDSSASPHVVAIEFLSLLTC